MILNSFLPPELISLLQKIEDLGFNLCLVGGAVRDHLAQNKLSHDLDFEIRADHKISDEEWPIYYERLINFFQNNKIKMTKYPYLITKIDFLEWNLEFSSPRLEDFESIDSHSHHNFKALLSSQLTYEQSFKRRDFTINAIGFEINCKNNSMGLIDPFLGVEHLKNKTLCNLDNDFYKDSVRFLRLIRFSIKYEMNIDPRIEKNITNFNLSALSKYHFTAELFKTDPGKFLNRFREYVLNYNLKVPSDFEIWIEKKFSWSSARLATKENILNYVYEIDKESAIKVQSFFSLPEKLLRKLNKAGTK